MLFVPHPGRKNLSNSGMGMRYMPIYQRQQGINASTGHTGNEGITTCHVGVLPFEEVRFCPDDYGIPNCHRIQGRRAVKRLCIPKFENQIRTLGRGFASANAFQLNSIRGFAQTGSVLKQHQLAFQVQSDLDNIPCRPRDIGNDSYIALRQGIQQR